MPHPGDKLGPYEILVQIGPGINGVRYCVLTIAARNLIPPCGSDAKP